MIGLLVSALFIAGYIIYKLNESNEDNQLIKSNYKWKEDVQKFSNILKHLELEKEKLLIVENVDELEKINKRIEHYEKEIIMKSRYIENNVSVRLSHISGTTSND